MNSSLLHAFGDIGLKISVIFQGVNIKVGSRMYNNYKNVSYYLLYRALKDYLGKMEQLA